MQGRGDQEGVGVGQPIEESPSPEFPKELVRRICESSGFRKSRRLQEFLHYTCEKWIAGESAEIHERQIAIDVFGRDSSGYDPSSDNTVRVQARILRQKLAEYFAGEGAAEQVVLEIPKGGYIPTFAPRNAKPGPVVVPVDLELAPPQRVQSRNWKLVGVLALLAVSLVVNAALVFDWHPFGAVPSISRTLTALVVQPGTSTLVVVPDTGYVVAQVLTGRTLSLESYGDAAYRSELFADKTVPAGREFWGYLISRRFTDIFAADFYGHLARSVAPDAGRLELKHPRALHLQDFAGRNAILIGSPRSNPWVEGFADRLAFRFQAKEGGREVVLNDKPQSGEPPFFSAEPMKLGSGVCLAILSVVPNPNPPGRLMFIAGTTASVTDEIGKIALSREGLQRLGRELKVADPSRLSRIETVISAQVVAEGVKDWKVLASRTSVKE